MGGIQQKGGLEEEEGLGGKADRGQIFQAGDKNSPKVGVREKPLEV